jgi:hypothetical protein
MGGMDTQLPTGQQASLLGQPGHPRPFQAPLPTSLPQALVFDSRGGFPSAKYLTLASALMHRLVPASFQRVTPARLDRLVFVALTRAAKWAYFSTTLDDSLPLFHKLLSLEQTRQPAARRSDHAAAPKQTSPPVPSAPDNKLDFL